MECARPSSGTCQAFSWKYIAKTPNPNAMSFSLQVGTYRARSLLELRLSAAGATRYSLLHDHGRRATGYETEPSSVLASTVPETSGEECLVTCSVC